MRIGPEYPADEASFRQLVREYKYNAKTDSREFTLTSADVRTLTSSRCTYCGREPAQKCFATGYKSFPTPYIYNGIDREDNDQGYVANNCVPCCKLCNYIKREMTRDEFLNHIQRILEYSRGGGSWQVL